MSDYYILLTALAKIDILSSSNPTPHSRFIQSSPPRILYLDTAARMLLCYDFCAQFYTLHCHSTCYTSGKIPTH